MSSGGGYAYIDSSHPRRPGDVARLLSVGMAASGSDAPQCLHFSFHMFGAGVGELRLSLRHARDLEAKPHEIWRLKGNAGNSWFDSRVTVASLDDFQLVFEASVGNTGMGDIAIDNLAFTAGACPSGYIFMLICEVISYNIIQKKKKMSINSVMVLSKYETMTLKRL